MKKKILLFASTVLAAMAMTTSAFAAALVGDVNFDDKVDDTDVQMIMSQTLSKDYSKDEAFITAANLDQDKPFANTNEITANDAAKAYLISQNEDNGLYLQFRGKPMGIVEMSLDNGLDTKVSEIVEYVLDQDVTYQKVRGGVDRLVLGITVNGEARDTKLVNQDGWDIFANAFNSLYTEKIYKDNATIEELVAGEANLTGTVADLVKANSLPTRTNNGTDYAAIDKEYVKTVYDVAVNQGVLKHNPSAQDVIDAKKACKEIVKDKYDLTITLKFEGKEDKVYSTADNSIDELINALAAGGVFNYDEATLGDIYKVVSAAQGLEENATYTDAEGAVLYDIEFKLGIHDFDTVLVQK